MSKKINRTEEIASISKSFTVTLNNFRLYTKDKSFTFNELRQQISLPKCKKDYIISRLIQSGIIITIGRTSGERNFWFKDDKNPINIGVISEVVKYALLKYYYNFHDRKKKEGNNKGEENKGENKEEENNIINLSEEEMIRRLLNIGKYKIFKIRTELDEIK